ncbi:small GTP-binding protein [Histomonas meleagridis]|uniref:small GTP-binding protein n=1 Tax=Histomonas meleagridis TaxID=135588 RepID=UPI0035598EA2|nr:small GTP-binding protein [Histomonas meleagridis]KAH0798364.1 small GTP-binding protein [Histomonas meleagridis]
MTLKVVMLGNAAVGKTAVAKRFVEGAFDLTNPTLGIDNFSKDIVVRGKKIDLVIWDPSGQEKYRSMVPQYCRNANIFIIVYAVGDPPDTPPEAKVARSSFESIESWYNDENVKNEENAIIFICGNKTDLDNREITEDEGRELAQQLSVEYMETSALTGEGIEPLFQCAAEEYLKEREPPAPPPKPEPEPVTQPNPKKKCSICK